jgi:serine/threonine-protein kinase
MAATLYEAVSLRRAFPGEDAVTVATRIAAEHPVAIAELCGLDPHVDSVLSRALAKDPKARFPTCEDFGNALAEALQISPRAKMATLPDRHHRTRFWADSAPGRLPVAIGSALVGAVTALGVGHLVNLHNGPGPSVPPPRAVALEGEPEPVPVGWLAPRPPARQPVRSAKPETSPKPREPAEDAGNVDPSPSSSTAPQGTDAMAPPDDSSTKVE